MSGMSFKRVPLKYYQSPCLSLIENISNEKNYMFTLRGILGFAKGLKKEHQYEITFFERNFKIGGTPDTVVGKDISDRVKINWERISRIEIREHVLVK